MKYRADFVTNSSSVSFIIPKDKLTNEQIDKIKNHIKHGNRELVLPTYFDGGAAAYDDDDAWTITETDTEIKGYIQCDWFPMEEYLEKIGVKQDDIEWENDTDHWDRYPKKRIFMGGMEIKP